MEWGLLVEKGIYIMKKPFVIPLLNTFTNTYTILLAELLQNKLMTLACALDWDAYIYVAVCISCSNLNSSILPCSL